LKIVTYIFRQNGGILTCPLDRQEVDPEKVCNKLYTGISMS